MTFEDELRQVVKGDLLFDTISRTAYSVDASIYEVLPTGILQPKDSQDIVNAVKIAAKYKIPISARGAGTGIAGGALGTGLIIDHSRYMNAILNIDYENQTATVEPGIVQEHLNKALADKGYRLGPDTSTGNRATLGGMLGNNSAGARSLRYGEMVDNVLEVDLVLASGEIVHLGPNEGAPFVQVLENIRDKYRHAIEKHFPKIPRRSSGYSLDQLLLPGPINPSKIIAGSEGSLGVATKIKVKIEKKPVHTGVCVIHFNNMLEGMDVIPYLLSFHPLALEVIDDKIIEMGRLSPTMKSKLGWLYGNPECVFVAEFEGNDKNEIEKELKRFQAALLEKNIGYAHPILIDQKAIDDIWDVRKAGQELLLSKRSYSRALGFIEDVAVAPESLAAYMRDFLLCLKSHNKDAGIYGHAGPGCLHIRPYIDLRKEEDVKIMQLIMNEVADLTLKHGGAMSGEHGDGRVRSWLNKKMFGEDIYKAFLEIKYAFDPHDLMNPGKKVNGTEFLESLRLSPQTKIQQIPTFLDFSKEGGFELAADLCNGNGLCRKKESVMCPSFQASTNEYDTTRARAQALRAIINSRIPPEEFTNHSVHDVLDLCLQCKGCKKECPSEVDMAKMKTEQSFQYQEKHGYSLRSRLIGSASNLYTTASRFPSLFNFINENFLTKMILSWIGFTPHRTLPSMAKSKFSDWFKDLRQQPSEKQVVLFNDTYTEYLYPQIGISAVTVLNKLGYQVICPIWTCCGRPQISKGILKEAKQKSQALVELLYPYAKQGLPILTLEPSCFSAIIDDYFGLNGALDEKTQAVASKCLMIDQFLDQLIKKGELKLPSFDGKDILFHGHCHQKSLVGTQASINVLKSIPNCKVTDIPSGCCGMAGSFGYEKEHYEFSMKIGELKLLPAVRKANNAWIVADGISCREQISHGSQKTAIHLIELVNKVLN